MFLRSPILAEFRHFTLTDCYGKIKFRLKKQKEATYLFTYLSDFDDYAGNGTISNKNSGADADTLGKALVRAGDTGVVTFNAIVSHDF
jgi:hypothetical protein